MEWTREGGSANGTVASVVGKVLESDVLGSLECHRGIGRGLAQLVGLAARRRKRMCAAHRTPL